MAPAQRRRRHHRCGVHCFPLLDETVAFALGAWAFPLVFVAKAVAPRVGFPALLALNGAVQAISWFLAVQIGHGRFEPTLVVGKTEANAPIEVSSNVYFDRGYFLLRNVGRRVSALASFQQFAISPFAATLDVLFLFGYRPKLRARIGTLVGAYLARMATGKFPLPEPSGRRSVANDDREPVGGCNHDSASHWASAGPGGTLDV